MQSRITVISFLVGAIIATAAPSLVGAPEQQQPQNVAESNVAGADRAQIADALAAVEKCFNDHDAKGLVALWKRDGRFIGPHGERIVGRENIETAFRSFFAEHKDSKLRLRIVDLHRLTDDAQMVEAIADVTPAPESLEGEPRSTILLVRSKDGWQIDTIKESAGDAASHAVHLKDLGWLVGNWVGTALNTPGATVRSTYDWTANHSFLIRKFTIEHKDGSGPSGTEVIGWDPHERSIRSWVFESDGGFGQSRWTRDGNRWMVKYSGVLADGGDVSATHVLSQVDADTLTLQSIDRSLNGQKRPDVAKVTVKRTAAKPQQRVLP
jgi:uncharacterized protein (TIGR02246 family)